MEGTFPLMEETTSEPRVRLNLAELDRLLEELGCTSDSAKARYLGIGYASMSRFRHDQQRPGNKVIARVRSLFPHVPYERLFVEAS